jgi:uncharacterized membrane protein
MRLVSRLGIAFTLAGLNFGASAQIIPTRYYIDSMTVTDINPWESTESTAWDINDRSDIVGEAKDPNNGKQTAVIRLDGAASFVSLHDGTVPWSLARAYGINNQRLVVGGYTEPVTGYKRAFYYFPGIWLTPLDSIVHPSEPYDWQTTAFAVNSSDRIVGSASLIVNPILPPVPDLPLLCHMDLPVRWNNTIASPQQLFCIADPDGDNTWVGQGMPPIARDINNIGNIVGTDGGTTAYSMFIRKGAVTTPVPPPAGMATVVDGKKIFGHAYGVNELDNVVGAFGYLANSANPGEAALTHAFYWDGVSALSQDLGTLANGRKSYAHEVNDQKMVVGLSERRWLGISTSQTRNLAFIWHKDFGLVELPALDHVFFAGLGWIPAICDAKSVNNRKTDGTVQVVGYCVQNGFAHAVRWDLKIKLKPIFPL